MEVIGILFLYSFVDARHEHQAKAIAQRVMRERGIDLPVVCSADVAPVSKENNRLKSLLFQCFAAELVRDSLMAVETQAKAYGYKGRLLTLLSYGGAVNMEYERLYETMISGPIGGLIGAQFIGEKLGIPNIVTADMGGTSFDVGLIVEGRLGAWYRERALLEQGVFGEKETVQQKIGNGTIVRFAQATIGS